MTKQKGIMFLRGVPVVLASELRIPLEERDECLYYYDVRHSDDDFGEPATVESLVRVNHQGTIATILPLLINGVTCLELDEEESHLLAKYI